MAASTHAHIPRRFLGAARYRTQLRGLGDTTQGTSAAAAELLQQGFSQQQIDALQAAGADESTMMGIATADNSTTAYNGVMSGLTGVPVSSLASVGIGASAASWFNEETLAPGMMTNATTLALFAFGAVVLFLEMDRK